MKPPTEESFRGEKLEEEEEAEESESEHCPAN